MPSFSERSQSRLSTCHPDLQRLFNEVIKHRDCTIICGHRGKADQEKAKREATSKANWGQSNHNFLPSMAVDVMPYPINWDDRTGIHNFAGFVEGVALVMGIRIRWGGDFKTFFDGPHYELVDITGAVLPDE